MHTRILRGILLGAVAASCGGLTTISTLEPDAAAPPPNPTNGQDGGAATTADARVTLVDASVTLVDASVTLVDAKPVVDAGPYTHPFDCYDAHAADEALRGALGVDYLERRRGSEIIGPDAGGAWRVEDFAGTKCGGATSKPTCEAALAALESNLFLFGSCGGCLPGGDYFAYTKGDAVGTLATLPELLAAASAVDTAAEAWMVSVASMYQPKCDGDWLGPARADGIVIRSTWSVSDCPIQWKDVIILVRPDGGVEELESILNPPTGGCVGRRPSGLLAVRRLNSGRRTSVLGHHFAEIARLEAASVDAFHTLRTELQAHGAPGRLVRAAGRAARDEVVHARMMARIARRHGASVERPRVVRTPVRPLFDIALENAIEGCVRETYGAAEGLFQSRTAAAPDIRRAMRSIAADETRHGALSWSVAAWLDTKLSPRERARVREAQEAEVESLARSVQRMRHPDLVSIAGVPGPEQATAIVASLRRTLWRGHGSKTTSTQ